MSGFTLLWLLLLGFCFPPKCQLEKCWNTHNYPLSHGSPVPYHVFRPDANAGVDQGAGQVQSEDQNPPADPRKPRRTAAPEGAEERQRIFYSLRLLLPHGCRAPEAGASAIIRTNSPTYLWLLGAILMILWSISCFIQTLKDEWCRKVCNKQNNKKKCSIFLMKYLVLYCKHCRCRCRTT